MNNTSFQRSHGIVWGAVILLMTVPIAFIWITIKTTTGDLISSIPFLGGFFLLMAYLSCLPVFQLLTKYSDEGIEQPSFLGSKFLPWREVQEIRNITAGEISLIGADKKIGINMNLFLHPHAALLEIRSRIPEHAFPSEAQINEEIRRRKQNDAGRSALGALIFISIIIFVGDNVFAVIFGVLMAAYMIYQVRNWLKYRNLQS